MKVKTRKEARAIRHARVRKKISGTAACPRLSVMISNKHMYVQLIDDEAGRTLAAASSLRGEGNANVEQAKVLGQQLGEVAQAAGISRFVTDRGGFRYHGRAKAVIDAALEAGLSNVKEAK